MKTFRTILATLLAGAILQGVTFTPRFVRPALFPGTLLEATYIPTPFKSIQRGLTCTAAAGASGTTAISAVTLANTALITTGVTQGANGAGARTHFNSTTQVGCTSADAVAGGNVTVFFDVVEWLPQFVVSRQTGSTGPGALTNVTLSPTVSTKAQAFYGGTTYAGGAGSSCNAIGDTQITTSSNVAVGGGCSGGGGTTDWIVLDFK